MAAHERTSLAMRPIESDASLISDESVSSDDVPYTLPQPVPGGGAAASCEASCCTCVTTGDMSS